MKPQRLYQLTAYPCFFKHTYWGSFKLWDEEGNPINQDTAGHSSIIANRNALGALIYRASSTKTVSRLEYRLMNYGGGLDYDHPEEWDLRDGRTLFLASPYDLKAGCRARFEELLFEEVPPQYSPAAVTFARYFAGWKEVRDFLQQLTGYRTK